MNPAAGRGRDESFMRLALQLARRATGHTSPNPIVGAVLTRNGRVIGRGWHRRAGEPHAEIEALRHAAKHGHSARGATLYVTLEPCCSHGRTPPCTDALIQAGIHRVVAGTTDPNPRHSGKGFRLLKSAGLKITTGILAADCQQLNEAFNHWIVHGTPFVTVKTAMTLDGKIATATGQSKWITSLPARAWAMKLRQHSDAILVGINTVLADNPSLTFRPANTGGTHHPKLRRIILDAMARTPLAAKVVSDSSASLTTVVVSSLAPKKRVAALAKKVNVLVAPTQNSKLKIRSPKLIDIEWLLKKLGSEEVTGVLVEGGGEVNASFLLGGHAQRVAFFYAPIVLGGQSRPAVAGTGAQELTDILNLTDVKWRRLGPDLLLIARIDSQHA